jgi:predicted ribosome quality control (RQC) complex YloA/Tae2 family protein
LIGDWLDIKNAWEVTKKTNPHLQSLPLLASVARHSSVFANQTFEKNTKTKKFYEKHFCFQSGMEKKHIDLLTQILIKEVFEAPRLREEKLSQPNIDRYNV